MIAFPNAKINLGLNIVAKRTDGYHEIASCFYPIPWEDSLEVIESDAFSFHIHGAKIPGKVASNLCVKAYHLLKEDFDLPPVVIHLLKQIPMGAGLGGGSADGAFTLSLLNEQFSLGLGPSQLESYALQLGSDCPFFVQNQPSIATGRGEVLSPVSLNLSGYYLALYNPGIHISSKEAYAHVVPQQPSRPIEDIIGDPVSTWHEALTNDFEASILPVHKEIATLKQTMYTSGAVYASMTGSGSTVYGLFKEKPGVADWKVFLL